MASRSTTTDLADLERRLWEAADQLRANSTLTPSEYRGPILASASMFVGICRTILAGRTESYIAVSSWSGFRGGVGIRPEVGEELSSVDTYRVVGLFPRLQRQLGCQMQEHGG